MLEFNEVEESETCREAKAWLLNDDGIWCFIGQQTDGLDGQAALDLIEELYARGAVKVWAYNIQSLSGDSVRIAAEKFGFDTDTLETVDELVVDMPNNDTQRKAIFSFYDELFNDEGEDLGQESILFRWF